MKRLVFFAHYDPHGIIDEYVLDYIEAIVSSGAERILFASDSSLDGSEKAKLPKEVECVCDQKHGEYDFGSWKRCFSSLQTGEMETYDELILCNDSCYHIQRTLNRVFEEMSGRDCDYWGMTQVQTMGDYYPSYFLALRQPVLRWSGLHEFFARVGAFTSKEDFCVRYEVGLNQLLRSQGFRGDCFLKQFKSLCHSCSRALSNEVLEAGMPFIRVITARTNPGGIAKLGEKISNWCAAGGYPMRLIENHLNRTSPDYRKFWNCPIADQTYEYLKVIKVRTKPNIRKNRYRLKCWLFGIPLISLSLPLRVCGEG